YRTQKALRDAPVEFGDFRAAAGTRTPAELVRHMTSVLGYARTFFIGGRYWPEPLPSLNDEIARFHEVLGELAQHLAADNPWPEELPAERLLQGPLAETMTRAGQLASRRRLAGTRAAPANVVSDEMTA